MTSAAWNNGRRRLCRGRLVVVLLAGWMLSGCQMGRQWFRLDSDSRSPALGIELRADAEDATEATMVRDDEQTPSEVRPAEHLDEVPRRRLPDWLRFPQREESIPLPTTPAADDEFGDAPAAGPSYSFE